MRHRVCSVALCSLTLTAGFLVLTLAPAAAQQMQMQSIAPSQAEVIRGVLPTVVNIASFLAYSAARATTPADEPVSSQPKISQGAGFIIDPSGVILTNFHVIDGAQEIYVTFSDGVRVPGRILATAHNFDLALVKVDTEHPLMAVRWADSDKVQIADPVFAIGNPLSIGLSVSAGIVSALNRNTMSGPYDDFIQTDAAINHGNSGGPLFNRSGEVIGVATSLISPTTGSVGLGFATPANDARYIADQLLRNGDIRPAFLGIKIEDVTQDIATALGMSRPMGSIVSVVIPSSPAAAAGLQVGDVILRYDDQTLSDQRALLRTIVRSTIGQAVPVTVLRADHEQTLLVTPTAWPEVETPSATVLSQAPRRTILVPPNLGLSLSALTDDLRARYGLPIHQAGVLVDGVAAGTDAFDRDMAPGDVVLRVQDTEVNSPQEVQAAVDAARAQHKAFILVLVLPRVKQSPGPHWMALKVTE